MDDTPNIYSLFTSNGPTAQEKAAAMAAALRRQRDYGNLLQLSGNSKIVPAGQSYVQQAQALEQMLGQAGSQHNQQGFTADQSQMGRDFQAGESEKGRAFQGRQHALDRAMRREIEGVQNQRSLEQFKAKMEADKAGKAFSGANDLRKEFNALPEVKDFKDVEVAFNKVNSASKNPTAAGDLSLVFAYMKMLDPGSTVREGEFANAARAAGAGDRIVAAMERVDSGKLLAPDQRADFVNQAAKLLAVHRDQFGAANERYRDLASKFGFEPDDIAPQMQSPSQTGAAQQAAPARSAEDQAAIDWAKANKNDPRAKAILEANGESL